jgi:hypothetical protein
MRQALDRCEPLQRLRQRLAQSKAYMDATRPMLPPPLRASVIAGPIDADGWTMLAANPAVAAKLRQLLPRLEEVLRQQGFESSAIKVRVQSARGPAG